MRCDRCGREKGIVGKLYVQLHVGNERVDELISEHVCRDCYNVIVRRLKR